MKVREEPSKPEVASRRLCIVGRDRHLSGEWVASFATALGAREEFEIIEDRRRGEPPMGPPPADRRVRQHVTHELERDGFAIVEPFETRSMQDDNLQLVEGRGASPIERLGLEEEDERRLERILGFNRRRRARLRRRWILIGVLVALPVVSLTAKTFVSRTPVETPLLDGSRAPESLRRSVAAQSGAVPTKARPTPSSSGSRQ